MNKIMKQKQEQNNKNVDPEEEYDPIQQSSGHTDQDVGDQSYW